MYYGGMLKSAMRGACDQLKVVGHEVKVSDLENIVTTHAASAAVAAMASGWLPGVGSTVATAACLGFVVAMYVRLAASMGITMSKGLIRAVASAVVADIAAYLLTVLGVAAAVSFIPFVGNLSSSVLTAIANFACVYIAALIFVEMLNALMARGVDLNTVSEGTLKDAAKAATASTDMKAVYNEAKQAYEQAKKNGEMDKPGVEPDK